MLKWKSLVLGAVTFLGTHAVIVARWGLWFNGTHAPWFLATRKTRDSGTFDAIRQSAGMDAELYCLRADKSPSSSAEPKAARPRWGRPR